jgi:hypothetical protein
MYLPIVPVIRVYFNRHGTNPWSVDFGVGTKEYIAAQVIFHNISGNTIYAPDDGDNINTPIAFIVIKNSSFTYYEDYNTIHIGSIN